MKIKEELGKIKTKSGGVMGKFKGLSVRKKVILGAGLMGGLALGAFALSKKGNEDAVEYNPNSNDEFDDEDYDYEDEDDQADEAEESEETEQ